MQSDIRPLSGVSGENQFGETGDAGPLRVLLYSHDSWGLGHLRRSLTIAGAITQRFTDANALVVTGSPVATQFDLPPRCDVLKLPAVSKDAEGRYIPRHLSGCVSNTIELRTRLIHESFRSFDPQLVIVDHQLTGLHGEALPMLRQAREAGKFLVYGLRDVLDDPDVVARAWDSHESRWALWQAYDRICIYGTPEVFDPRVKYAALKPVRKKIEFTGYIAAPVRVNHRHPVPSLRKKVLVTVGGGGDGEQRIAAFIDALLEGPVDWNSHIVTGPLMDPALVRRFKRQIYRHGLSEQVRVSRFYSNMPRLLQETDAVVSMAGYNSCAEILKNRLPAVLLPRSQPRKEQLIRAQKLESLGLAQCVLEPSPAALRVAVEAALGRKMDRRAIPDMEGLSRICGLVDEWARQPDRPQHLVADPAWRAKAE